MIATKVYTASEVARHPGPLKWTVHGWDAHGMAAGDLRSGALNLFRANKGRAQERSSMGDSWEPLSNEMPCAFRNWRSLLRLLPRVRVLRLEAEVIWGAVKDLQIMLPLQESLLFGIYLHYGYLK